MPLLPLPMTAQQCLDDVIVPCFHDLLPGRYWSRQATWLLLTIAIQESGLKHRRQVGGPALGLWQFEEAGVRGVMSHEASRLEFRTLAIRRAIEPTSRFAHLALASDDLFACAVARLLLWTDPTPLPRVGDTAAAFAAYLRTWRPGAYAHDPQGVEDRFRKNAVIAARICGTAAGMPKSAPKAATA